MQRIQRTFLLLALLALGSAGSALASDEETRFARVATDDFGNPRALQMAIVSYAPDDGSSRLSVDLVSAVHIGDATYYAELNERFTGYDALLYELVAPPGAVVKREDGDRKGFVSNAQLGLTRLLNLAFQLDEVDYTAGNFVHADLSAAELSRSMDERGESLYVYFWRLFYASIHEYAKDPLGVRDLKMMTAIMRSGEDASLKTMFAYEMTNLDAIQDILGEDSDSAVIGARNERAVEVLRRQLDAGSGRVGIFYGVGHMPDLEQRLLAMGLVRRQTTWVDAWNLQ